MAGQPHKSPQHEAEGDTAVLEREETKKPRRFYVIMYNDDFTTQEFVVHILLKFFRKDQDEAFHLMMAVHSAGLARVGLYSRDVAESKVETVIAYARQNGMPLLLTTEPE